MVAVNDGAGRGGMNAELVLDRMGAGVVARAERAVGVEQELGYQKRGNALRSRRRVGKPRQHLMNDVVGEIGLTMGEKDLLPGNRVPPSARAPGLEAQAAHA